jgi:hypothetical protein
LISQQFLKRAAAQRRAGALFPLGDGEFLLGAVALRVASWGLMNPGISDFSADNPPVRARLAITPTAQTHQQNRNNKRALISSPGKLT